MLLLVVRHAHAGEHDPVKYPDDTLRPITSRGRTVHAEVCAFLRRRKLVPGMIFSSPWKRAWETGQVMVRELSKKKARIRLEPAPSLAGDPDLEAIRADLAPGEGQDVLAVVGHEPWLSNLASQILTGEPHRLSIDFPKSGVIGLETDAIAPGSGMLRFFVRPKLV